MRKSQYLRLCMQQPASWLLACAASPSPYMSRAHVALVRIALRRMGA